MAGGGFYDTRGAANRDQYLDVSESKDPEVIAARKRFEKYLQKNPVCRVKKDPSTREAWKRFRASPEGAPVKVFPPDLFGLKPASVHPPLGKGNGQSVLVFGGNRLAPHLWFFV